MTATQSLLNENLSGTVFFASPQLLAQAKINQQKTSLKSIHYLITLQQNVNKFRNQTKAFYWIANPTITVRHGIYRTEE